VLGIRAQAPIWWLALTGTSNLSTRRSEGDRDLHNLQGQDLGSRGRRKCGTTVRLLFSTRSSPCADVGTTDTVSTCSNIEKIYRAKKEVIEKSTEIGTRTTWPTFRTGILGAS